MKYKIVAYVCIKADHIPESIARRVAEACSRELPGTDVHRVSINIHISTLKRQIQEFWTKAHSGTSFNTNSMEGRSSGKKERTQVKGYAEVNDCDDGNDS